MKMLPFLATLLEDENKPRLNSISMRLQGERIDGPIETWGGLARRMLALRAAACNPDDRDDANGLDYDFEALAEIFGSSAWRNLRYSMCSILGWWQTDAVQPPHHWQEDAGWWPIAMAGEQWRLYGHSVSARRGLFVLRDEGLGYKWECWFYMHDGSARS